MAVLREALAGLCCGYVAAVAPRLAHPGFRKQCEQQDKRQRAQGLQHDRHDRQKAERHKWLPSDEWRNKLWHTHTMECYSAIKRTKLLYTATRCMNLEDIVPSEKTQSQRPTWYMNLLYIILEMSRIGKSTGVRKQISTCLGLGGKRIWK